jgi:hypothetical protein
MSDDATGDAATASTTALRRSLTDLADVFTRNTSEIRQDIGTLERFLTSVEGLRREAARRQHRILVALGAGLVLILVALASTLWIAAEAKRTSAAVADCTTAGGKCYENGRRQTSDAVGAILKAESYQVECARLYPGESGPAFDVKFEACVSAKLQAGMATQPAPSPGPSVSPSR